MPTGEAFGLDALFGPHPFDTGMQISKHDSQDGILQTSSSARGISMLVLGMHREEQQHLFAAVQRPLNCAARTLLRVVTAVTSCPPIGVISITRCSDYLIRIWACPKPFL